MTEKLGNWAGNYIYQAPHVYRPESVEQVQQRVRRSSKVKALGTRHSFNEIADSAGELISLENFNKIVGLDREHRTVTVEAGVRYGQLATWLHEQGFALHNLASLPHISVAGACATGTHGSGDRHGNLSTAVSAMEIVTADGELITLSREKDGEQFRGAVVGLGGLGVVTRLTLDVSPTFDVRQDVYQNLPLAALEQHFDELFSSAYSVSLFTDWRNASFNQVWLKRSFEENKSITVDPKLFGATLAISHLHPIAELSAENCTEQMGIRGPWHERLPHFRMDFTPSSGEELQSEYLIPRQHTWKALGIIQELHPYIVPLLQISEVRSIAADDLWMSPCYQQACIAIHFTWKKDWEGVKKVLPMIEDGLAPFHARPHWAKLFMMSPERLEFLYEKTPDFRTLLQQYDPDGKFRNGFLDKYIFRTF